MSDSGSERGPWQGPAARNTDKAKDSTSSLRSLVDARENWPAIATALKALPLPERRRLEARARAELAHDHAEIDARIRRRPGFDARPIKGALDDEIIESCVRGRVFAALEAEHPDVLAGRERRGTS